MFFCRHIVFFLKYPFILQRKQTIGVQMTHIHIDHVFPCRGAIRGKTGPRFREVTTPGRTYWKGTRISSFGCRKSFRFQRLTVQRSAVTDKPLRRLKTIPQTQREREKERGREGGGKREGGRERDRGREGERENTRWRGGEWGERMRGRGKKGEALLWSSPTCLEEPQLRRFLATSE